MGDDKLILERPSDGRSFNLDDLILMFGLQKKEGTEKSELEIFMERIEDRVYALERRMDCLEGMVRDG